MHVNMYLQLYPEIIVHNGFWKEILKGCFNNISHEWLIKNIPMDKSILKQFLKAGFIFKDKLFPTNEGTPQGGIISPILANMALDGLQEILRLKFRCGKSDKDDYRVSNVTKVNYVRYTDDFIVTAATEEIALQWYLLHIHNTQHLTIQLNHRSQSSL